MHYQRTRDFFDDDQLQIEVESEQLVALLRFGRRAFPERADLRLVTAALDVYNNVNAIGRAEYARQNAKKALAGIGEDGRLHIGEYVLQLAVFTSAATS